MKILATVDAGGIRSYLGALMIGEVIARVERLYRAGGLDPPPEHSHFDLLGGVSGGGLWAQGTASGLTQAEVGELFRESSPEIFRRSRWRRFTTGSGMWSPRYSRSALMDVLEERFGDARLGDARVPVMVLSTRIDPDIDPEFFKSWREEWGEILVREAAYATSAAPTYFPSILIRSAWYVDGGVINAHPGRWVVDEARKLWPGEELVLLSVGTGRATEGLPGPDTEGWGKLQWAQNIPRAFLEGGTGAVDHSLRHDSHPAELRYFRFDPVIAPSIDMDDASQHAVERLDQLATGIISGSASEMDEAAGLIFGARAGVP